MDKQLGKMVVAGIISGTVLILIQRQFFGPLNHARAGDIQRSYYA
ncbi:hypothetical protein [Rhodophyticola sp.]|jgi:hypothetical protein